MNNDWIGCRRLNRKAGARPARSRHCIRERLCNSPLGNTLGRRREAMNWSQENCPIDDHRLNLRGMGKGIEESASTKRPDFGLFSSCFYCSFPFAGKSFSYCHKVFPYGFSSIGKHCSYISFIFIGLLCGPGRRAFLRPPSSFFEGRFLFCRKVFSMVSALWRNIAHTFFLDAAFAAGLRSGFRRLPFFSDALVQLSP